MKARNLFLLSLSLTLAACGGSGGGGSSSDGTGGTSGDGGSSAGGGSTAGSTFIGMVGIEEDTFDNTIDANATFIRYAQSFDLSQLQQAFQPTLDQCVVDIFDDDDVEIPDDFDFTDTFSGSDIELVSAGEVITLRSASGSYLELAETTIVAGVSAYLTQSEVDGPMPAQLTLDIPGAVYPQFANVSMPVVQSLVVTSPALFAPITTDTNFTWTAGNNPDAYLEITLSDFDGTSVDCAVKDDGAFSFPAATKAKMGSDFNAFFADISRIAVKIQQQNNALLLLMAESSE